MASDPLLSPADTAGPGRRLASALVNLGALLALLLPFALAIQALDAGSVIYSGAVFELALVACSLVVAGICWCWHSGRGTPGLIATGCRLVDAASGRPPSLGQCLGRCACFPVSLLMAGAGYLAIFWDDRHRAWHDRVACTEVIVRPH